MARVIFWLVALPLFVGIVVFAVVNPGMVELSLWPLVEPTIAFPVYGVALIALLLGFVVGAAAAWMGGRGRRQHLRAATRQAEVDQRQIEALRGEVERLKADGRAVAPSLPPGTAA